MKTEVKVLAGILIVSLVMLFGAVFFLTTNQPAPTITDSGQVFELDYTLGQKIGSDSAKIKLVEFSDFQCPACKGAESSVKQVLSENKDHPDFQFIYRHFPLPQHVHARAAANFAEYAATQGKFWEVHGKLFETQEKWTSLSDVTDYFVSIGKEVGLNEQGVKDAVQKSLFNQKINEDLAEGQKVGVNSTPSFYLNGRKLLIQNFSDLNTIVEQALNEQ